MEWRGTILFPLIVLEKTEEDIGGVSFFDPLKYTCANSKL